MAERTEVKQPPLIVVRTPTEQQAYLHALDTHLTWLGEQIANYKLGRTWPERWRNKEKQEIANRDRMNQR